MESLKMYTLEEVAIIARTTRRTLYNYLKNGKLKAVKIGKNWLVSEENLNEFLHQK